ncbi:MAG: hypothetical protein WC974_07675 [Thermoplasmata archaeon]
MPKPKGEKSIFDYIDFENTYPTLPWWKKIIYFTIVLVIAFLIVSCIQCPNLFVGDWSLPTKINITGGDRDAAMIGAVDSDNDSLYICTSDNSGIDVHTYAIYFYKVDKRTGDVQAKTKISSGGGDIGYVLLYTYQDNAIIAYDAGFHYSNGTLNLLKLNKNGNILENKKNLIENVSIVKVDKDTGNMHVLTIENNTKYHWEVDASFNIIKVRELLDNITVSSYYSAIKTENNKILILGSGFVDKNNVVHNFSKGAFTWVTNYCRTDLNGRVLFSKSFNLPYDIFTFTDYDGNDHLAYFEGENLIYLKIDGAGNELKSVVLSSLDAAKHCSHIVFYSDSTGQHIFVQSHSGLFSYGFTFWLTTDDAKIQSDIFNIVEFHLIFLFISLLLFCWVALKTFRNALLLFILLFFGCIFLFMLCFNSYVEGISFFGLHIPSFLLSLILPLVFLFVIPCVVVAIIYYCVYKT